MLERLALKNILSFGPSGVDVTLRPLNVLIGPNGSGKSNLIEVIWLMSSFARLDTYPVVDWLWKGQPPSASAKITAEVRGAASAILRYSMEFTELQQRFAVISESLREAIDDPLAEQFLSYGDNGQPKVRRRLAGGNGKLRHYETGIEGFKPHASVLNQLRDPSGSPEITTVGRLFTHVAFYREAVFGPNSAVRLPQRADLPSQVLMEGGANLALVLKHIQLNARARQRIRENLVAFYPAAVDVDVRIEGGTVQVVVSEEHWATPATRLSDGTVRWLCLLAVLLDPQPPPMICIDEPEVGLHPDILPILAKLLVDASTRTQVIITTHSDILVDALQDDPERIIVCEKQDGSTTMRRLSADQLKPWLKEFSLGHLWRSGEIGGNRF